MKTTNLLTATIVAYLLAAPGCGGGSDGDAADQTGGGTTSDESSGTDTTSTDDDTTSTDGDASDTTVAESLQGQWLNVETAEHVWIGADYANPIEKLGDDLIKVTLPDSEEAYLIRAGIESVAVSGQVAKAKVLSNKPQYDDQGNLLPRQSSGYSGIANIDLILRNIQDDSVTESVTTDDTGAFDTGVPSGTYTVEAEMTDDAGNVVEEFNDEVAIDGDEKDLGVLTVAAIDEYNFKSHLDSGNDYIYFGTLDGQAPITYNKTLSIDNIGSADISSFSVSVTSDDSAVRTLNVTPPAASGLPSGDSAQVGLEFSFVRPETQQDVRFDIEITDYYGNQWEDYFLLPVSPHIPVTVHLNSEATDANGYVITPGRTPLRLSGDDSARIPYVADTTYEVTVANSSVDSETKYALGLGTYPDSTLFDDFTPLADLDVDSTVAEGQVLNLYDAHVEYLVSGDVDAYSLQFTSGKAPFDPSVLGAVSTGLSFDMAVSGSTVYIADEEFGLKVVDVSDASNPTVIATVDTPGYGAAVAVENDMVYLADADSGLQVIDVSSPMDPTIVGSINTPGYPDSIAVESTTAYVADTGLQVIDVSDPISPAIVGSLDTPGEALGVAIDGTTAYVADGTAGLQIVDIADPTAPEIVSSIDTGGARDVAFSGTTVFVAGDLQLDVVDVSNRTAPATLGSIETEPVHLAVDGTNIFVAFDAYETAEFDYYMGGLQVVDVEEPTEPSIASTVDTPGHDANAVAVDGTSAYLLDGDSGLQVIQLR